MFRNDKGFTLVEVIVVLAILAIMGTVTVPQFSRFVEASQKKSVMLECRNVVLVAETLYVENSKTPGNVTSALIKQRANAFGDVSGVEVSAGVLSHLTYTKAPWTVTYCRDWEACPLHSAQYNLSKGSGGGGTGTPEATAGYFYIADDANYKVSTIGDLETYDFGPYGSTVPQGSVFYWQGQYYFTRNVQYLTNSSDRQSYINNYGVKINKNNFVTPGPATAIGDLKLENGKVYIFFPYARYQGDYADPNYWLEVVIE